jgi:hypothetical protein
VGGDLDKWNKVKREAKQQQKSDSDSDDAAAATAAAAPSTAAGDGAAQGAAAAAAAKREKANVGLPRGWTAFVDEASHDVYYGNLDTHQTSWERPT